MIYMINKCSIWLRIKITNLLHVFLIRSHVMEWMFNMSSKLTESTSLTNEGKADFMNNLQCFYKSSSLKTLCYLFSASCGLLCLIIIWSLPTPNHSVKFRTLIYFTSCDMICQVCGVGSIISLTLDSYSELGLQFLITP